MALALLGARHMFSHMQLALRHQQVGSRVSLKKGVHQALADFRLMLDDISTRPTRINELIPLLTSTVGHHDASGVGAGGVWFIPDHIPLCKGFKRGPVVWQYKWPTDITARLITESNPHGSITSSDLKLAGGLLHLDALVRFCDVRERTILSKTDNLATLYWQRKGSTTTDKCPAHLLRLFGLHQRYHRYIPCHDYLSGPSNPIADASSWLFTLANKQFLSFLNSSYQ